jgi:hypothetical protein
MTNRPADVVARDVAASIIMNDFLAAAVPAPLCSPT